MLENKNLRNICLNMLIKTLEEGELSHLCLREAFVSNALSPSERAFVKRLFTGTLEKLVYLDFVIGQFSSVPFRKMKPVIRNILRMSLYQLEFMDSIPDYSVIDEAVRLARKRGFNNLCPFVNGILRKAQREAKNLKLPEHVNALFPEWIYDLLIQQYGQEKASGFFEEAKRQNAETVVRFNLGKADESTILSVLDSEGVRARRICLDEAAPENMRRFYFAYGLSGFDVLTDMQAFKDGLITVQDPSSMLSVLNTCKYIEKPSCILDVCAAPGGKSLLAAEIYPDAQILSGDLTEAKIRLIRENTERTGTVNVKMRVWDACTSDENLIQRADMVIADLPCSGLGVTGKKPDILYRLKKEDLEGLAQLQRRILDVSEKYVKPGGLLVYSTCTVNRGENEENTAWFLKEHDFELLEERLFLRGEWKFDGFYCAYLRKKPDTAKS